ncbi:complement receptor type 2-like [Lytechinus variegatus]|uniref:complement receptor type 2-like n=1 Tax=Lytechinus variegatus TaxID=7654 RepID=UPI001BB25F94|nr:complement receptor type 2-like [Lytechinus variegatus]
MITMSKLNVLIGFVLLWVGLISISGVKGDCPTDCTAPDCCYDEIPQPLGDGGDIVPIQDCYSSGSIVNYNCSGNLRGPPNQICNNGAWSYPFAPTCEAVTSCPKPTVPTDGSIDPNENQYDLYTRISYACDDGYSLVGPDEAVCESGGTWNPSTTPSCEASCDPPTLDNGYVDPNKTSYMNGEVLNYECNANYTLVGVSTTTCRNGVYDPSALPTCFSMCSPPVVENSDYDVQRPPVDHASTITIECDQGYSTGTGTDQDLTCNDGSFNDAPPVCYANCQPLSETFENGVRSGDTTPFYHDEQVSYRCNTGYSLVGSSVITCKDGNWTDDEPVCKENCVVGEVPDSNYATGGTVIHGDIFNVTCDDGYSTGTSRATELSCDDGTLSPGLPTCYGDCTPPTVPYSDYRIQKPDVFHNAVITVSCWGNYSLDADSQSTNLSCNDGNFEEDTPTCYENCPEISAPDNGVITDGESPFYHLEKVSFECNENFTLIGASDITCNDGSFDNSPPICSAQCKPPVIPKSNSTSSSPLLESGSNITVVCDDGYSNGQSRSTTSTCDNGELQPAVPLCYEDCTPPVVRDSDYDTQKDDVFHSTEIIIACDAGYSTGISTTTTLTCIDGNFNGTVPVCYADCTPPVVPYSNYQSQQPDVFHDTDFIIQCWSNYSTGPVSQETTVTCDNGTLSNDDVTCFENCEVPLVEDSDYSEQKDDVFHLVTFNVTCDDGYSNSDDIYTTLTCTDGDLNDADPTCYENCPDFGMIEDGSYSGDAPPFYHNETVSFTCNTNHTLIGIETLICSDGNWSAPIPSCKADCLPPVIANSNYNASNPQVIHDTTIAITCDTGYSTGENTTQLIQCIDGDFSPEPLQCLRDCTPPIVENSDYATQADSVFTSQSFVITCNANYTVGDGDSTATTTLTCDDGELNEQNVTCYANCPDPGQPTDGEYELIGDGFYHGTVVYYYCDARFDLEGESELVCDDGEWSSPAPNCTDKSSYDLIMLTCGPTSMEVGIPKILLEDIDVDDIGMEGNLSCAGYIDGDMMRVNTSLSGCGTNKTENSTHDTYTNRVVNNYFKDVITRVVDIQIPLKCSYPRNEEVRAVRYAVLDYVLGKNLEETGTYKMTFGIYNTSLFTHRYADGGAVDLDINDRLFFQLQLVTDVADNFLVADQCWATPSEDSQDSTSHALVDKGCPSDDTLQFLTGYKNGEGTIVRFELRSFRFVEDDDKEVYVHCEVFVCHEDSTDSFCNSNCDSSRKRRYSDDHLSGWERAKLRGELLNKTLLIGGGERAKRASAHHDPVVKFVKAGPFRWNVGVGEAPQLHAVLLADGGKNVHSPNDGMTGGQISQSSSSAWMHSVIGLGVIVVVFAAILLVVVKHYKRRLRRDYRYQALHRNS